MFTQFISAEIANFANLATLNNSIITKTEVSLLCND